MSVMVGGTIHQYGVRHAAYGAGLPLDTPKSGIIRAALAVASGMGITDAIQYAKDDRATDSRDATFIAGRVPDDLVEKVDAKYDNRSYGLRVGMAMLAGMDRAEAEAFAHMAKGPKKTAA
jgi:hypothetical protein